MSIKIRRVVSGQTSEGKSIFTHVEDVKSHTMPFGEWYGVWAWDELPRFPYCNEKPFEAQSVFPGAGGARINAIVFPAGYGVNPGPAATPSADFIRLITAQDPGGVAPDPKTGMHWTNTIDLGFVIEGELVSIQDDGAEVTLRPGDLYVQNGAVHSWQNRTDRPCLIYIVNLGTTRVEGGEPASGPKTGGHG